MLGFIKRWYYRRLFLKIYFIYLKHGNNPQEAANDAYEDVKGIRDAFKKKLI